MSMITRAPACRMLGLLSVFVATFVAVSSPLRADVYISDGDRVGRYSNSGALINADFISLFGVTGLAIGPEGNLYASTPTGDPSGASAIFRYDALTGAQIGAGPFIGYLGLPPSPNPHDVINPQGLRFRPSDGNLYVADLTLSNVHAYDAGGNSLASLTGPTLTGARNVAFDDQERLYVTSSDGVLRYDTALQQFVAFTALVDPGNPAQLLLNDTRDLAFGPDDKLYVLDGSSATPHVLRFNADGSFDARLIDFGSTAFFAAGLTVDLDGKIYVSGYDAFGAGNGEVRRYNSDGTPDGVGPFIGAPLTQYASFMVITPEPATALLLAAAVPFILRRRPF